MMNQEKQNNPLAEIQAKLKAPKGQFNSFGKYHYRSAEDILEAVKKVVNPMGFSIVLTDQVKEIGGRIYVEAIASLFNGELEYSATGLAREEETKKGMDGSQITGSASSYARKLALNGLFAIDDTKDSDSTNDHGKLQESKPQAKSETIIKSISDIEYTKLVYNVDESKSTDELKSVWDKLPQDAKSDISIQKLFSGKKNQLAIK